MDLPLNTQLEIILNLMQHNAQRKLNIGMWIKSCPYVLDVPLIFFTLKKIVFSEHESKWAFRLFLFPACVQTCVDILYAIKSILITRSNQLNNGLVFNVF